jgi:hypothetical protein
VLALIYFTDEGHSFFAAQLRKQTCIYQGDVECVFKADLLLGGLRVLDLA